MLILLSRLSYLLCWHKFHHWQRRVVEEFDLHLQSVQDQTSPQSQSNLLHWKFHRYFSKNLGLPLSWLLADIGSSSETDLMALLETVKPGIGKASRRFCICHLHDLLYFQPLLRQFLVLVVELPFHLGV